VTLASDATVGAAFAANPPPPPADECAGLTPASLPDPVSVIVDSGTGTCMRGTSDDGDGTFLLGVLTDFGLGPFHVERFYEIQDGKAVQVGKDIQASDAVGLDIFSEPSGFSVFLVNTRFGHTTLENWSHEGALVSTTPVAPTTSQPPASAAGVDPSGGTALGRTYFTDDRGWITTYQRFSATGGPESPEILIDKGQHPVGAVGITLSGHALVLVRIGTTSWQGQWVARDGTLIGGAFTLQAPSEGFSTTQFLLDGSLAVGFAGGPFAFRIEDGSPVAGALPDWLQQRAANQFFAIRAGRAYATWGAGGKCDGNVEVVAASGKSCGCVNVPDFRSVASIGRDSSLIVPGALSGPGCTYKLYPKLFR